MTHFISSMLMPGANMKYDSNSVDYVVKPRYINSTNVQVIGLV